MIRCGSDRDWEAPFGPMCRSSCWADPLTQVAPYLKVRPGCSTSSAACWDPSASPAQLPQFLLSLSPFPPTHDACRLYFQCGLRTSHACPARRTVDLSCWDPSAPLVLNYHCTHNHLPHYHAAGAATTPAPLPKDRAVKNCLVRAIKRAVVKEEATTAKSAGAAIAVSTGGRRI
ncbi:unnamed protein product [Closterium sp. Naga37s-1]|nr:unnamed protein product [Closterium sp. Naga37s-1]